MDKKHKEALTLFFTSAYEGYELERLCFYFALNHPSGFLAADKTLNRNRDAALLKAACKELLLAGKKIEAIKLYRNETGASLKDAKEIIESFQGATNEIRS